MKIRVNKIDTLFSRFIRTRDKGCQWCGRQDGTLQCSHIFGRRHMATRWDPLNAKTLCFTCHRRWHEDPVEAFRWIEEYLGKDRLDELRRKAHGVVKLKPADKEAIYQDLKLRLEGLESLGQKTL